MSRRQAGWRLLAAGGFALAVVAGLAAYALTPAAKLAVPAVAPTGAGQGLAVLPDGRPAPSFSLPRLGGGAPVSLGEDRGHPVILNFFASWCPNCREELKAFAAVSSHPGSTRFIGIDTNDDAPAKAQDLLRAAGDRYPVGIDPSAAVANGLYLVQALPVTIFVRSDGRIAGEVFGAQTVESLRPWISRLDTGRGNANA